MTASDQAPVNYTWDPASQLTQMSQGSQLVTFQYDNAGRRVRLTLPNQVSTEYQYDPASQLTALIYRNAAGQLGDLTYTYDPAGNRTGVGGTLARTLLPDPVASASYDAANRQLTFGGQTLTYDANGNLASDNETTYAWDARDRLLALNRLTTASFQYDPLGRRAQKTVNANTTRFLYDQGNPILEVAESGGNATMLTSLFTDEYLTRTDGSGVQSLIVDALGDTLAEADPDGAVITSYSYEPFGRTQTTGVASGSPYQYTGRENDGTGLYYYRARYYSPSLQRFTSEDPIGFQGGPNLYAYAVNNPLRWRDPLGLDITLTRWKCCYGFDHIGIGVNTEKTEGFYPERRRRPFDRGVVSEDLKRNESTDQVGSAITIKTTPEQDQKIKEFIDRRTADPGRYNILSGRHCGGFVQEALRAAGIDPFGDVAGPGALFETLKAMNNAGVDFTLGVSRQAR